MPQCFSEADLEWALHRFARMAGHLISDQPSEHADAVVRTGEDSPPKRFRQMGKAVQDRLVRGEYPGSSGWHTQTADFRTDWWVKRIAALGSSLAAAPTLLGPATERVPLQGALSTAAQGLAVCTTAHEYGVTDPEAWTPLLGRVLFDLDLTRGTRTFDSAVGNIADALPNDGVDSWDAEISYGAMGLLRLTRSLYNVQELFDSRPGATKSRGIVGRLPIAGTVRTVRDEWRGVRLAAEHTVRLVAPMVGQ